MAPAHSPGRQQAPASAASPMPGVVLRRALPPDAERLAVLGAQVWLHTYADEGVTPVIADYVLRTFDVAAMRALVAPAPDRRVTVAESADALVGYAVVALAQPCPDDPALRVELVTLHIQEHFARRGIGTALLRHAEALAHARGSRLWLTVNARNDPALAFYAHHGYAKIGTFWFELGGARHENHVVAGPAPAAG